jgi:acyl-coenzyme A synthetase/AMP-(fatty) acid ligase
MNFDIFKTILTQAKYSKKKFLINENKTYKDFYYNSVKICKFIQNKINKNETICICANYSFNFISLIFASYLNKNPITFINPNASQDEKNYIIKDSSAKLIFFDEHLYEKKNAKKFLSFYYSDTLKKKKLFNCKFIIYTSGTTNKPKGVLTSVKAISNNVDGINKNLRIKSKDRGIIFSPPAYAMGVSQILTFMLSKCSFAIHNSGVKFPNQLINKVNKGKISVLNLSISAFRIIKKFIKNKKKFKNIRLVMAGGMQFTTNELNEYKKMFPNAKIINFYGCTENAPRISHYYINSDKNYKGIIPVGKPIKGVKIKIIKPILSKFGQIQISGSSMMNGYNNLKQLTKKKIVKGWFKTGDIGFFDKSKNLFLLGREDNTFRVGHEKLCPEEVESQIKKDFKLSDVIILKIKDEILNWKPVCILTNKKKISINKIKTNLKDKISNYKIPKEIYFIKSFPKTSYGKIDRKKLEITINKNYEKKNN